VGGGDLVSHDSLTGFVANEHIDHSTVSIGVSGLGLSGGGTIAANRTITLASSSNPGAAASILASDASGYLQLTGLGIGVAPTATNQLNLTQHHYLSADVLYAGSPPAAANSYTRWIVGGFYWNNSTSEWVATNAAYDRVAMVALNSGELAFITDSSDRSADPSITHAEFLALEKVRISASGGFGIGTATIPHGAVGAAKFAMDGTNASTAGPHVQFTTATDNYPLLQILNWVHDGISVVFDAYYDGAWKSSDAGSNFQIHKNTDLFKIEYDSGVAQGGAVTWNAGLTLDTAGDVHIGEVSNNTRLSVYGNAVGQIASFFNDGNDAGRYGISIQCGADDGSGVTLYMYGTDGNGDEVGGLRNNSGTFQVYDSSDEATKVNIARTTRSGLDVIRQVEIYDFNRAKNPHGPRLTGTIAQNDLKLEIPGMVAEMRDGKLATSHSALIPFLVLAVQEQQETIEQLTQLIN